MIQQCALATKNASGIVGCIRHNISYIRRKVILPLCSARQGHTQSAVPSCGFSKTRDVDVWERVQRMSAKEMKELECCTCEKKLREIE